MSTGAALPSADNNISKEMDVTTTMAGKDDNASAMTTSKNDAQDVNMSTTPTTQLDTTSSTNNNRCLPDQFDTTSRKVVIHNVLKYIRTKEITKLTNSWLANVPPHITAQLSLSSSNNNNSSTTNGGGEGEGEGESNHKIIIEKVKKPPKDNWMKVTLKEEYMVDPFIQLINTCGPPPSESSSEKKDDSNNGSSNSSSNNAMRNARGGVLFAKRADEMFTKNRNEDMNDNNDDGRKRKERGGGNNDGKKESRHDKRMRSSNNRPPIKILSNDEV